MSQASKDCVNRTETDFLTFGPGAGVEFVYKNDDLPFGFPNGLGPEVTAMKEAGVDFITTCIDQNSVLVLEQELERQGMGDVVVALPQGYSDSRVRLDERGAARRRHHGRAVPAVRGRPRRLQHPVDARRFEASGIQLNDYAIQGWFGAQLAAEGIIAAGPQFDRASVVAATNAFTEWTNKGMTPTVDWSTRAHRAGRGRPVTFCMTTSGSSAARSRWPPTRRAVGLLRPADRRVGRARPRRTSTDRTPDR